MPRFLPGYFCAPNVIAVLLLPILLSFFKSIYEAEAEQLESTDQTVIYPGPGSCCGVQCLYVAARLIGKHPDLTELARQAHLTDDGVSLLDLKRAAESIGLQATGEKYPSDRWHDIPALSIVHFSSQHFVVVIGAQQEGVEIVDPPSQHKVISASEFTKDWTGDVLTLQLRPATSPISDVDCLVELIDGDNSLQVSRTIDLGEMKVDGTFGRVLAIHNTTVQPFSIDKIITSCGCTTIRPDRDVIQPGATVRFPVSVATRGLAGPIEKSALIKLKSPRADRAVILVVKGTVHIEGKLFSSLGSLELRTTLGLAPTPKNLILWRGGGEPLNMKSVSATMPWLTVTSVASTLDTMTLSVGAKADLAVGQYKADILVQTDDREYPRLTIPISLTVNSDLAADPMSVFCPPEKLGLPAEVFSIRISSVRGAVFCIKLAKVEPHSMGTVNWDSTHHGREIVLEFHLSDALRKSGSVFKGSIHIVTDLEQNGSLDIPVVGKSEARSASSSR